MKIFLALTLLKLMNCQNMDHKRTIWRKYFKLCYKKYSYGGQYVIQITIKVHFKSKNGEKCQ